MVLCTDEARGGRLHRHRIGALVRIPAGLERRRAELEHVGDEPTPHTPSACRFGGVHRFGLSTTAAQLLEGTGLGLGCYDVHR